MAICFFTACDKKGEAKDNSNTGNNTGDTKQGTGVITLKCNGTTFVTAGNCNYSSIADCIVVADSSNSQNVFTINLNGGLPAATRTYMIIDEAVTAEKVSFSFTRFPGNSKMFNWESADIKQEVTLSTEGNKITCSFSDIPLEHSVAYNPDSLAFTGTCSGSFVLYK